MARINKGALTRVEIVTEATKQFLENGYSNTTVSAIAKGLGMSQGNVTFHYPTKEHLLAELVEIHCQFLWKTVEREANEGMSSILAICLELATMLAASENDDVIRDFFYSAYASPLCVDIIRRNDARRAKEVFGHYRPDWTDVQFAEAEILVSGVEYASLMKGGMTVPIETRIVGALHNILGIYGIPEEIRNVKIQKVLQMDYRAIGEQSLAEFRKFVSESNEHAFEALLKR